MSAPDPEIVARLEELLASVSTLVLATPGERGEVGAAPLFFVADGLRLYWLSSPSSRHSRGVEIGEVAVAVFLPTDDWQTIRGAQMKGRASAVADDAERARILDSYRGRFRLGPELDRAISQSTLYRFSPAWIRYLDNNVRFGYRFEFTLAGTGE